MSWLNKYKGKKMNFIQFYVKAQRRKDGKIYYIPVEDDVISKINKLEGKETDTEKVIIKAIADEGYVKWLVPIEIVTENKEEYFYFNKEIYINILDKELQNQIDTIKYPTHWKYRVNGLFSRNGFGMGKLDIYTGKILKLNLEK